MTFTKNYSDSAERLRALLERTEKIVIGAGAGLSASAGFGYTGRRFLDNFADFIEKYGFTDMYSGGFFPFETLEEHWAYWSRYIDINRYSGAENGTYEKLLALVKEKDYFVLTTNVDHQFQKAGFDKNRLFYTQGDFGLFQCSKPCHNATYENEEVIHRMVAQQKNMRIPAELIPYCPKCGRPMSMNLRSDDTFVQAKGWYRASERYQDFIGRTEGKRVLFLELGVGMNTPGIVKFPFWEMTAGNPEAVYVSINEKEAYAPPELAERSLCIRDDIRSVLRSI